MAGYGGEMGGMGMEEGNMEYESKENNGFLNVEEQNKLAFSRNKGEEC